MSYETKIEKRQSGWNAKTDFNLGIVPASGYDPEGVRFIRLATSKDSRGNIATNATVFVRRAHSECHAFGLAGGGDFRKTVQTVVGKKATERAVREYHNEALANFPAIIEEAKAYYANNVTA